MYFLPYQTRWMRDSARIKVMEKSRQIGLSWCTAYELVRGVLVGDEPLDVWVSSRDETQARLFLDDCQKFAGLWDRASRESGGGSLIKGKTALSVAFRNGRAIHGLSSSVDAQAGKRGTRVLDEFALHSDPEGLYVVAYPGITWGGRLEILSTHRGADNFFNHLIQEARSGGNPKGVSLHRVTLEDALNEGFLTRLKRKLSPEDPRRQMTESQYYDYVRRSCVDEATFQQEYMCMPEDESSLFLTHALIDACKYAEGESWSWEERIPAEGHDCYVGVDLARHHDLTVFWVLERVGDCCFTRLVQTLKGRPFAEQEGRLCELVGRLPHCRRVCIDQTGMGAPFAERVAARLGQHRVEGVTLTSGTKDELACALRFACEARRLRIPDQKDIVADLRAVRRTHTSSGHARLSAEHGAHGHADRFWALALALHAASPSTTNQTTTLTPLPKHTHGLFI